MHNIPLDMARPSGSPWIVDGTEVAQMTMGVEVKAGIQGGSPTSAKEAALKTCICSLQNRLIGITHGREQLPSGLLCPGHDSVVRVFPPITVRLAVRFPLSPLKDWRT